MVNWTTLMLRVRQQIVEYEEAARPQVRIGNQKSAVLSCEFDKTGEFLLSSNRRGRIQIHSIDNTADMLTCLKGHTGKVTEVHYSMDGASIISSSMDKTIGVWDTITTTRKATIFGHTDSVNTVQCSQTDSNIFCSGSSDEQIRIWDLRQRVCTSTFRSHHAVAAACFSRCGRYLYNGGLSNGDIIAWDIRRSQVVNLLAGHSAAVTGLSVSPSGKYLASCSADGTLGKWNLSSLRVIEQEYESFELGQSDLVELRRCAWSKNERLLSAGDSRHRVIVFDANNGKVLEELDGHRREVTDVAFHPNKPMMLSAGVDKCLILHNV